MEIRRICTDELPLLTQLFDYNDPAAMISQVSEEMRRGMTDIFVMFDGGRPVGELHASYESGDERTVPGRRAYLFAFRISKEYRGQGLGKQLLQQIIDELSANGYTELTIGVEDDDMRAKHIYSGFGFTELIARKYEEYQGDKYEYGLYLRRPVKDNDI